MHYHCKHWLTLNVRFLVCWPLSFFPCRSRLRPSLHSLKSHCLTLPCCMYITIHTTLNHHWWCGVCEKKWLMTSCRCYACWEISSGCTVLHDGLNQMSFSKEAGSETGICYEAQMKFSQPFFSRQKFLVPCFNQQCSSFKLQGYFIGL